MTRCFLMVSCLVCGVATANAQFAYPLTGSPYAPQGLGLNPAYSVNPNSGRPAVSPYLNLLNGNYPALNYYGGVRPLLQNQNAMQQMQQPMAQLSRGPFFQPQPAETKLFTADEDEPQDKKRSALVSPGGPVSFGNFNGSSHAGVQQGGGGFFNRGQQGPAPKKR
jgi:hypothetical protein